MNWEEYRTLYDEIIKGKNTNEVYNEKKVVVELNNARVKRWIKTIEISSEIKECFSSISNPQKWILIVEPWCMDAANIAPVIFKLSQLSPMIDLDIQLRDAPPFLIEQYLTNGAKAVPKLIVRNEKDEDIFIWGARPNECQQLVIQNKSLDISADEKKALTQKWYNEDKGISVQNEIYDLMKVHHLLGELCSSK